MKLLMCNHCGDVFNLQLTMKQCSCGHVKGRYVSNTYAEVNGNGYSLAIGNGSLWAAIANAANMEQDWRESVEDVYAPHPTSVICWVRPHIGPANPHTSINPGL